MENCDFCDEHEQGDDLFNLSHWDGGLDFEYIRNIKYCPICGKELKQE